MEVTGKGKRHICAMKCFSSPTVELRLAELQQTQTMDHPVELNDDADVAVDDELAVADEAFS